MKPKRSLPVLLVSACDRVTAEEFISELIDNEVSETEGEKEGGSPEEGGGRVWRLVNKYYTADVLVRAHADSDPPYRGSRVEAHVAYFTPEECESEGVESCAERRASGASGAGGAGVRLAALRSACEEPLASWAARARYEPVPLLAAGADGGLARARDALHAHVWPGLQRHGRAALPPPTTDSESSSCGEEEEEEGEEEDVERAEQFALALGALGELAGAGAGGRLEDGERRQRAEQLLEAFCRALGQRLD